MSGSANFNNSYETPKCSSNYTAKTPLELRTYYPVSFQNNSPQVFDDISQIKDSFSANPQMVEDVSANAVVLENYLNAINKNNGIFLKSWNNIKEKFGRGITVSKCEDAIQNYKNGKITYSEAYYKVKQYENKQRNSLNMFSNIATTAAAIGAVAAAGAITAATGGAASPLLLLAVGAATGAVTKTGFKFADRATNQYKGDALDAKQIAKDAATGAFTGALASISKGKNSSVSLSDNIFNSCIKAMVKGVLISFLSCTFSYIADCINDKNQKFDINEFVSLNFDSNKSGNLIFMPFILKDKAN